MNRTSSSIITSLLIISTGATLSACGSAGSPRPSGDAPVVATAPALQPSGSTRTINVRGIGTASETPDKATITIGVETNSTDAQSALRDNNAKAAELLKLLKVTGIEDKDLQTSQLSIYPQYDVQNTKIVGYQVSNLVTATVNDISKVGAAIDAAAGIAGNAIRIQNLSFGLSDDAEALKKARTLAVENATLQAEQLAAAAGVKVGALRIIGSTSVVNAPMLYQLDRGKVSGDAGVPIAPGSADVTAEVDLVFDLVA